MHPPEHPPSPREDRPDPFGASSRSFRAPAGRPSGPAPGPGGAQIASLIARTLQERLARGLNDPRVQGMVSILGVDLSPDRREARVRVSVMPAHRGALTISGLRSAARHLGGVLREETRLRMVPRLRFELDESLKREAGVLAALGEIAAARPADPDDEEAESPDAGRDEPPAPTRGRTPVP
jgi:ribosome-binding factor A